MHKSGLTRRDRLWLAGLALLFVVWVFVLGMWFAGMRQPGGLLGGPPLYIIPAGYHLVPNVWPSPVGQ